MNLRRIVAILCTAVLLSGCNNTPKTPHTYDEIVASTIITLREYWTVKLHYLPGGYTPIPIYAYDSPDDLECDGKPALMNNASFCSKSHLGQYMGFDVAYLRKRYDVYGPGWIYFLFAHEFAHSIQDRVDQQGPNDRFFELQADCLAGAYIGEMYRTQTLPLTQENMVGIQNVIVILGDDAEGRPGEGQPSKPDGHGTGAERYERFYAGYTDGIPACGLKDVG